jgi:hypothetical protein
MRNDDSSLQPYPEPSRYGDELYVSMVRAGLKAIPFFGAAADEAVFGPVEALRQRRFADTLAEVADTVRAIHGLTIGFSEELGNLVEVSAPSLGRAVREEKRTRFRDLLINAAPLPPGDAAWEETLMVSRLLSQIDAPGLAVVVAIAKNPANRSTVTAQPSVRVYDADTSIPEILERPEGLGIYHEIPFAWPLVEEWMYRLGAMRLVGQQTVDARGGFGSVCLRELGLMLVRWATK